MKGFAWKGIGVLLLALAMAGCGTGGTAENGTEEAIEQSDHMETAQVQADAALNDGQAPMPEEQTAGKVTKEAGAAQTAQGEGDTMSSLKGKKVSFCGDSITTFTGYIPEYYSKFYPENGEIMDVNDTWWMQVVNRTGMELLSNASFSGSTVSGQSQDNHEGRYACGNQRMADLAGADGSLPEVIIVLMGANDLLNDIPLGAYDGVSAVPEGNIETFSEAYALMLYKMKTWYPDAQIYCCTIAEVSRWNDAGEKFPFRNAHSAIAADYNAWITQIAQAKGLPVIDVYQCGITYENAGEYTSDGTHPNAAGAKLIADQVCGTLQ